MKLGPQYQNRKMTNCNMFLYCGQLLLETLFALRGNYQWQYKMWSRGRGSQSTI